MHFIELTSQTTLQDERFNIFCLQLNKKHKIVAQSNKPIWKIVQLLSTLTQIKTILLRIVTEQKKKVSYKC